jgi:hypothetical protein
MKIIADLGDLFIASTITAAKLDIMVAYFVKEVSIHFQRNTKAAVKSLRNSHWLAKIDAL